MNFRIPQLHAVTNDAVLALPDFAERVRQIAKAGNIAVHIRSRALPTRDLLRMAEVVIEAEASLFVNDRLDVALATGAGGIHLPANGLPIELVRDMAPGDLLVGRSTHSSAEAVGALRRGADYVFLGPIWSTASHPGAEPVGVEALVEAGDSVIAIGGVTASRVAPCVNAGAFGVAAIRAIWFADDITANARAMLVHLSGD